MKLAVNFDRSDSDLDAGKEGAPYVRVDDVVLKFRYTRPIFLRPSSRIGVVR